MKNFTSTLIFLLVIISSSLIAQVNYSANDQVTTYTQPFLFGSNFGYNPPWQDEDLANIAAGNPALGIDGAGVKSSRPTLPGWFMEEYGYDFRLNTYQHYDNLGLKENVCIVGFPSDDQRDLTQHCSGVQSEMFANLYTDIWDGGANGTPYNDDNYYAAYLYKTVSMYKDYVKFWEIWNEPGFDYSGNCGWREPGDPVCNWWDNDPDPCINKLRAPIQHYVRTLRISYDIIKTLDPDAYVIIAGVGFESFLDAILRNTDNPVDGSVTAEYPNKGGAYFDVMGFHSYPHFDGTMKYWDNTLGMFVYERHSDKGAGGVLGRQSRYQSILDNYGYDGVTYPEKEWIITEINGPRKQFQDFVGSEEYQRNFLIKASIVAMKNDIRAMHVYNLAERKTFNEATGEFDLFGLYEKVLGTQPYSQVKTSEGVAYKTTSDLIAGSVYDEARSAQLGLPNTIDGGAFIDPDGNYTYVLWAKTTQDMSEVANASYAFPGSLNISYLEKRNWEYSETFESSQVDPGNIQLTGEPAFFTESIFSTDISAGCEPLDVVFQEQYAGAAASYNWTFEGGIPSTSTAANPTVAYQEAGTYEFTLNVLDGSGNTLATQSSFVVVDAPPSADFNYTLSGPIIVFENTSSANAESYNWVFGDGNVSTEKEPSHVYDNNGNYTVTLIASNGCGASTQTVNINVSSSSNFQIPYNANTVLNPYEGTFRPGTNFGYNPPWTDITLADLAAGNPSIDIKGVGVKASRPTLPGWFVEEYGYEFNLPNYEHYDNLGLEENVCIIGFPAPEERDPAYYCNGVQSEMFANMYSDIWDDGTDGTPYNDDNYLAAYLYKIVTLYGDDIRFWEIWNEPGFDYTGNCGWREPGDPVCNWWDNNPDPCDFKLRAPIMHYVRILRISYEIIKTLQPDDYLVVAGVGFPSYLDAILRNTDNPVDGSVTADYPNGGGAYFDVMGFHAYPHFDGTMRWWDNSIGGFRYERHSDQAITSITNRQDLYQGVLENYGYDGTTYPNKEWIITESNLPRREFQDYIGNEDAQINYMVKAVVTCYKQNIHQFHVYNLGEAEFSNSATREFDVMGLYQKLLGVQPYNQVVNLEGISYKTVSDILYGTEYDEAKTAALGLPDGIDGGAFIDAAGNHVYVLWAVTTEDQSETASATYSFPGSFGLSQVYKREWDYSETESSTTISPNNIALTGRPIYLLETQNTSVVPTAIFFPDRNADCAPMTVQFDDMSHADISTWEWTFTGPNGFSETSSDENPSMTFTQPGEYQATLKVTNDAGSNSTTRTIFVDGELTAGWTYVINGNQVQFTNTSVNGTKFSWDFGDAVGFTDQENPTYTYFQDGLYNVGLTVSNTCDTIIVPQIIEIGIGSGIPPTTNFAINLSGGCGPLTVDYINLSANATGYLWTFPGGTPSTSTDPNPTVVYNTPGTYDAILEASNLAGTTIFNQTNLISVSGVPTPSYTYSLTNSPTLSFTNNSTGGGVSFFWDFGDGNSSTQENPTHTYSTGGVFDVVLSVANACGSASTTQIVNVDAAGLPPLAGFSSDNINGCAPMAINFMDNSTNATSWNWSFPGGTPSSSTEQNPSVTYDEVGTYDVTLDVGNDNGSDMISQTSYITILGTPTTEYTFEVEDSLVTFTNFSTDAFSYSWNFGDGTYSTDQNPEHIFGASGVYEVVLTAANGCGSQSVTYFVDVVTSTVGTAPAASFTSTSNTGCAPLVVSFSDLSAGTPTSWNWSFPGGNPSTSTDQNPTVTYDNQGSYSVTLEVSNDNGNDIASQMGYVFVQGAPTAGFDFFQNDLTANFSNTSGNSTSYLWDFGDGTSSTEVSPVHTYAEGGSYTVTLTATNDCSSSTFTDNVNFDVVELPLVSFGSNVTTGCEPLTVEFADFSTGGVTEWNWSFPGGTPSISSEQNPTVVYDAPGTYNVTLVGTNGAGSATSTQASYIEVAANPVAAFTAVPSALVVNFNNTSTNAFAYSWDFGDGSDLSEGQNTTHIYDADGTYTVTLTATNFCGSVTTTQEVTVVSLPLVGFGSDMTNGCSPFEVQFTDMSTGTVDSWSWSFPGATPASSTEQNPTVTYDNPGTYNVTLVGTNAAGSNSFTQNAYINVAEGASSSFTAVADVLTVNFNNTSTNAFAYSWDFGDGNTSVGENPTHIYDTDGTYTVALTATNLCGSVTTTEQVTVVSLPLVGFGSDMTDGCSPFEVQFTDMSTGTVDSWSWSFPGATPATSTEQNPSVTYSTPGTYNVTLVGTNAAGSNSFTQNAYINVAQGPTASFTSSADILTVGFSNTSTNATTYSWDFGDGNTSVGENPTHIYDADGTYPVTLTATNDCGSVISTANVTVVSLPLIGFVSDITNGCSPLAVQFTDMSSANVDSWSWSFPGATPASSSEQNPAVTYSTPGIYNVTLVGTNAAGSNSFTQNAYISIGSTPDVAFGTSLSSLTATFTNTSTNAISYLWEFGDGSTSTDMNPSHAYTANGTYTVSLTASNACGSTTITEEIQVQFSGSAPTAAFTSNITTGCSPFNVIFSDLSSATATTWEWSFPGGNPSTSTAQNPSVSYDSPGMYDVTLIVSNAGGSNTASQTSYIVVNAEPTASFSSNLIGNIVSLTNTSTGTTSYSWNFGDGNSSTDANPTHTYDDDGTYDLSLTVTNECGTVTTTEQITVITAPSVAFVADALSGCAPFTVNFTDQSTGTVDSWLWEITGANPASSTDQNPSFTFDTPGTYDVTLTVTNSTGDYPITQTQLIQVGSTPTSIFEVNQSGDVYSFSNNSTGATSYAWDFGDSNSSTDANPTHTYDMDGTYTITLTATNECGSITSTETINFVSAPTVAFMADVLSGCAPLTVNFTDQSAGTVDSWLWEITGANPASSTDQNPSFTFDTPGTYDVTLTVTNSTGAYPITQTQLIQIGTTPTSTFEVSQSNNVYAFSNNSTGATSYAWDFGDSNSSTDANPTHTYDMDGTYTITLTATNECGSVTSTETVNFVSAPTVAFTTDAASGCAPLIVNFTDQSEGTVDSWLWEITGANPTSSTDQNPSFTFDTPGTYDVTLTITNSTGSYPFTQSQLITVGTTPSVDFTVNQSGGVYAFSNNSTGATSYSWDFGDDNTSTDMNPTHAYDMDGTYTITLTATNDCGSVTSSETVNFISAPSVAFTADVLSGCAPLAVQFTDQTVGTADSYIWEFSGGTPAISTDQNPLVTFDTPGTYDVTLTVTNSTGSYPITQTSLIVISDAPSAGFDAAQSGSVYSFTNNTTNATSYAWNFGDGSMISTEMNPTHTYALTGSYTVELIATNDCGSDTTTLLLAVEAAPVAGFSSDTTFGCAPLTVQFSDLSVNATSWAWNFDGGSPATSDVENPSVTYDTPGTYAVDLTVSNGVGSDNVMVTSYITIEAEPTAEFFTNVDTTHVDFLNASVGGDDATYSWDFGDGTTSTEAEPSHDYPEEGGMFTVVLTVTNNCGTATFTQDLLIASVDVNEVSFLEEFLLFPNPNDGQFTIVLRGQPKDELRLNMMNIIGQYIHKETIDFTSGEMVKQLNFDLPVGTYVVELRSEYEVIYKKVVIE